MQTSNRVHSPVIESTDSGYDKAVRPTRDDETTCNTAATINNCSLFAVSVSNDRRVDDAATATHETVYSKVDQSN